MTILPSRLLLRSVIKTIILFSCLTLGVISSKAQCIQAYFIETKGFYCKDEGSICIVTVAKGDDCNDYIYELEYLTASFNLTDIGDFTLGTSSNPLKTKLTASEFPIHDSEIRKCLKGKVLIPGCVFTLKLVNQFDPTDIYASTTFKVDDYKILTGINTVSALIGTGDLLTPNGLGPGPFSINTPQKLVINGTLIVDMDYFFGTQLYKLYNDIVLTAGSKVIISQGQDLDVYRANFYKCPEYNNWEHILALEGSSIECERTTISGANTGLWLNHNSTLLTYGADFFDNFCGLRASDVNHTPMTANIITSPASLTNSGTVFSNNKFGIVLYDASPIIIANPFLFDNSVGISMSYSSLKGDNISLSDNDYGVESVYSNSLIEIKNSDFFHNKIGLYSISSELDVEDNHFGSNGLAINILGFNGYHSKVKSNTFFQDDQGILGLSHASRAEISFNDIRAKTLPYSLSGIAPYSHIWSFTNNYAWDLTNGSSTFSSTPIVALNNTKSARVGHNTDTGNGPSAIVNGTIGISVSGGENNFVDYNTVVNLINGAPGIQLMSSPRTMISCNESSASEGLRVLNNNNASEISGNIFTGNGYNLKYGTALNTLGTSGVQLYRDNIFDLSTSAFPVARHYGSPTDILNSLYIESDYVGTMQVVQNGPYYPNFLPLNSAWFSINRNGENFKCGPKFLEPEDSTHFRMANENIGLLNNNIGLIYNSEVEFDTKLKLMRSLTRLNEIGAMSDEQQQWYDELSGSEYGQFIDIENLHKQASAYTEEQATELALLGDQIKEKSAALDAMTWVVYNEESEEFNIDEEVKAQFEAKKEELSQILISKGQILAASKAKLRETLPELNELNNSITQIVTTSAENLQTINRILYSRLQSDTLNYTDEEKEKIVQIANQCMGMGGEAVAQARSMRSEFDTKYYEYDDECLIFNELPEQRKKGEEDYSFRINPNPANETATLEITSIDEERTIYLINYMGKIVKMYVLGANEGQKNMDISELPSGLYYIKIEGQDQNKKLIKIN